MSDAFNLMRAWHLTPAEMSMVLALVSAPKIANETLHKAISGPAHTEKDIVKVMMHRLRKKLDRYGVHILTNWGSGYELAPGSADIIRRALDEEKQPVASEG